ncbi:putative response regulator [Sulfitobacter noctilucae]|uniref:response regulator n=1 Tax=Sulfitobacter noctilucae TaxID=1342302 RepID=UPI0004691E11|nr:response regulator [Sulfitobacter noctilucae]KIN61217.1 putative response regulator [Sulfitobacter noctilucae]
MAASKILIVDDSTVDRMIMRRAFDKAEITEVELEEAPDAMAALTCLSETDFDAVFLDINMPGENGFHVLRSVRENRETSWPLVFMYSSSEHPDDVARAYAENATGYLCKPTEFEQIKKQLVDCIGLLKNVMKPAGVVQPA